MILELIASAGLTVLSESSCPAIPHTESDAKEISELVIGFLGDKSINEFFEKVIEHKCAQLEPNPLNRETVRLIEHTTFEGYSPNTISSPDIIERDVLICKILRIHVDNELKAIEKRCDWADESLIRYPGIVGEIKLLFGVSADEARRFLDYLSNLTGESVRGERISPDVFQGVFELYGSQTEDEQIVRARYKNSCGVKTLSAIRQVGADADYRIMKGPKAGC